MKYNNSNKYVYIFYTIFLIFLIAISGMSLKHELVNMKELETVYNKAKNTKECKNYMDMQFKYPIWRIAFYNSLTCTLLLGFLYYTGNKVFENKMLSGDKIIFNMILCFLIILLISQRWFSMMLYHFINTPYNFFISQ